MNLTRPVLTVTLCLLCGIFAAHAVVACSPLASTGWEIRPTSSVDDEKIKVHGEQAGLARHVFYIQVNWTNARDKESETLISIPSPGEIESWTLLVSDEAMTETSDPADPLADRAYRRIKPQRVLLDNPNEKLVSLSFNVPTGRIKGGSDTYVACVSSAGDTYFVRATTLKLNPSAGIATSVAPGFELNQELEDRTKKSVGHIDVGIAVTSLFPELKAGDIYAAADLRLSTTPEDKSARLSLAAGYRLFQSPIPAFQYISWSLDGSHEVSQSGNRGLTAVSLTLETLLPIPTFGKEGSIAQMDFRPRLRLTPLRHESRRSVEVGHGRTQLFGSAASLFVGPIYLFPGAQPSVRTSWSVSFGLNGWYFPNEAATIGFTAKRFETSYSIEAGIPLMPKQGIGLILSYRNGADPANFYSPSATFGIALDLFGNRVRL